MEGAEEILLDLNQLAEGQKFLSLGAQRVSDDGNWLAYSTDTTGYRQYTLHVKDLRTGGTLSENIERAGSVVWATDNKTLFYTTEDPVSKRSDKFWRHTVGATVQRPVVRRKGRAVRRRRLAVARPKGRLPRQLRENVDGVSPSPRGQPGRGAHRRASARSESRVRRRSLRRPLLHHDQQERQEFPGRDRAGGDAVREELDAVHRPQPGDQDRRLELLREPYRGVRTRRRVDAPARDRSEDQGLASDRDRRTRLCPVAGQQSGVQHAVDPLQLPIDGDAVVGLRLRPDHPCPEDAQAPGGARRLRSVALRSEAAVGGGARRHEGADVGRAPQGHRARRQGAAAAVRLRLLRCLGRADVLVESPQPARSRRHLRHRLHSRRRRAGRGMAGARAA